ncbi:MAG: HAD-IA family hydrolase [Butyrivibrio sp.]|nr:HAD-IA family hydrolase [Butyrivibrio sp.]
MSSNKAHDRYGNVIPDGDIDTVVFDIGNVLTDFAWKEFLLDKGFDEEMAERIGNASVRTKDWNEIDIGNLSTEEIIGRFIKNDPEIEDELKRAFSDFNDIVRKRDRAIPWIEALKAAGYRVLYLSNFSEQALLGCPDAMSFIEYTDGGILSFRDHVIKPYPDIYRLLMERFDIVPAKTVFIDDTKPNVDTAVSLGWKGVVYKDYEQVKRDLEALKVRY